MWLIAIGATILQVALAILLAMNYKRISHTPIGKQLTLLAFLFVVQAVTALFFYSSWARKDYNGEMAFPLSIISLTSLIGVSILYKISRM